MKILSLICCLFLYVNAGPLFNAFLIEHHNKITENGYDFGFHSSDEIKRSETGQLTPGKDESILDVKGDYSYRSPDGSKVSVYYSSGENGYRAKSVIINKGTTVQYAPTPMPAPKPISTAAIASLAGGGIGRK